MLLILALDYEWVPFNYQGKQLTFIEHMNTRLDRGLCSHWGPAVYKWEGVIEEGSQKGHVGVLIGETGDLRQRIKQYVSGTQPFGNKYWRDEFLTKGKIFLYILHIRKAVFSKEGGQTVTFEPHHLKSGNLRVLLEQLLILGEVDSTKWLVNKKI
ncbi:hypothetical protein MOOTH_26980 [Moorella thermoacetica]|nr:hypothetical protein MOOTH_26980 [Moorella thermoacetica]